MDKKNDPTKRFTEKTKNYAKYRPDYPKEILQFFIDELNLNEESIIADIGSGTGIFTQLLLENRNIVYAVEPNESMRKTAENLLERYDNFISVNGKAESTNLESNSINLITSAQAFHWFNVEQAKREFKRILKPDSYVVLVWNDKPFEGDFFKDYESVISKWAIDYNEVNRRGKDVYAAIDFMFDNNYKTRKYKNSKANDFKAFKGGVLSASYMPDEDFLEIDNLTFDLKVLFDKYEKDGKITIDYTTNVYYGTL